MEKKLKTILEKLFKQHGKKDGEDLNKFPSITFAEAKIDVINLE